MNEPIAIISSTIVPSHSQHYGGSSLRFDPATRLEQTRATIQSLLAIGIKEIHLADNSGANWSESMAEKLEPARIQVFDQHPYRNKGVSELYLLLAALPRLPTNRPIIKLSGRYQLTRRLDQELDGADIVVRQWRGLSLRHCYISTIAYAVRDALVYERFLRDTLRNVFGFPTRIVGPGSLFRIIRNSIFPGQDTHPYDDPVGAIEAAAWRVLRNGKYAVRYVESVGTEGLLGQFGKPLTN